MLDAGWHTPGVTPVIASELRPTEDWVELLKELGAGLLMDGSIPSDFARWLEPATLLFRGSKQSHWSAEGLLPKYPM